MMQSIVTDGVAWSVTIVSPVKNGLTDRDAVWVVDLGGPKEPHIRWEVAILRGKGAAHCKVQGPFAMMCSKNG